MTIHTTAGEIEALVARVQALATLRQHAVNTMPPNILPQATAKAVADIGTLTEACTTITTLASRLAAAEVANQWLPIETYPKDGNEYDFWLDWADDVAPLNPPLAESRWAKEMRFRGCYRHWSSVFKATHWRPLPAPPQALTPDEGDVK